MKSKTIAFVNRIRKEFIDIVRHSSTNGKTISLDEMQENDLSENILFEIETLAIKGKYEIIKNVKRNANYEKIITDLIQGNFDWYFPFI